MSSLLGVLLLRQERELVQIRRDEGGPRDQILDERFPRSSLEQVRPVARLEDRIDDAGRLETREDRCHVADDVIRCEHPDLHGVGRDVPDKIPELVRHDGGKRGVNPENAPRRLNGQRGRDGHPVDAVAREDLKVHLKPRAAGRIGAGHREHRRKLRTHRPRRVAQACLAVLWLLFPLLVEAEAPLVIVLSWDGMRPDYLERADTPALDRIQRDGVVAERLIPVFPANTFPSHVSLVTGTHPDRHGIVSNVFLDRERGLYRYSKDASWIEAEPVWITAERQGVRAAAFFWVGSETDWNGIGATYRRTPFDSGVPEAEKVEQILGWVDLPAAERPGLILSWWHGCDTVGHRWGPDHARIAAQLAAQDRELGRLLEALDGRKVWPYTTLLLVSDHGMAEVSEGIDLRAHLQERGIESKVINAGGMSHVFTEEDPARVLKELEDVNGITTYRREDIPKELRVNFPSRMGDVVALTDPPRTFSAAPGFGERMLREAARLLGGSRGMHGYDPNRPDMGAFFLAMGRGVPEGQKLGPQRSIDVAPTITRLLGIDPPRDSEGTPIDEIGGP